MTWKTFFKENRAWNVFAWQIRRLLPLAALYWAAFLLLCLWNGYTLQPEHLPAVNVLSIGFGFLAPAWLFTDCFGRKQADFFHALPVKRDTFFLGSFAAGLAALWAPIVPFLGLRDLLYGPVEQNRPFPQTVLIMALMGACVLAFFTLAAVTSGTYFEYALTAALLTFGWIVMSFYLICILEQTIPGAQYAYPIIPTEYLTMLGSPPYAMFLSHMRGQWWTWDMAHQLPLTAMLGLLLGLLSWHVYVRRGSENSGVSRRNKGMRLYLRTQLGVTAAFGFGYAACCRAFDAAMGDRGIPFTLGAMAASLLGAWALTEFYYTHSLKKLPRHWLPLLLSFVVTAGAVGAVSTGLGLDTYFPDVEDVDGVTLPVGDLGSEPFPMNNGEAEYANLYPCVTSPENIEKVPQLQAKWIEAERASQYPYLPGRNSYADEESTYMGFTYLKRGARFQTYYYTFLSKRTPEAREKLKEFDTMLAEVAASEEYVESLFPISALDALEKVEKGVGPNLLEMHPTFFTDYQELPYFPKDFLGKLEEALREDFRAGRFPTEEYLNERHSDQKGYRLIYSGHRLFTAKGGLLSVGYPEYWNVPAAGRRLILGYDIDSIAFTVTPEMESTFALLEKEYRKD